MRDREFLIWLHERLIRQHGECFDVDYMSKLRSIIAGTPADLITANTDSASVRAEIARKR